MLGFLAELGEDSTREGLKETPRRWRDAWIQFTWGYGVDPGSVLKQFEDGASDYDELVFQGNIPLFSMCEHHLIPFFGVAHIGYIPNKRIVGLSKLARLLEVFARRLQVQERLTTQVADALTEHLSPNGVGVVLRCRHLCMEARGVQKVGTVTYTSALRGAFKQENAKGIAARSEFMRFVERADSSMHI